MKDKFRVTLRKDSAVCIRNNSKVVKVLRKEDMNISLKSLEYDLYHNYSLNRDIDNLIVDLKDYNDNPTSKKESDLIISLTKLNQELEELKLTPITFGGYGIPVKAIIKKLNTYKEK